MGLLYSQKEKNLADNLISSFLQEKNRLPYANLDPLNRYSGWVTDFHLSFPDGTPMTLDLRKSKDEFLLFILAIVWSRTGPWENSAFFVSYLKMQKLDDIGFWQDESNYLEECNNREQSALLATQTILGITPRKKVSFRKDIYRSIHLLAKSWKEIKDAIDSSETRQNFYPFMSCMRGIIGLGVGNNRMLIKIPLILRELRCQHIYSGISGEYCCVPDARVYDACKDLGISLPKVNSLDTLIVASAKLYQLFGDLYDLPLFAYYDLGDSGKVR